MNTMHRLVPQSPPQPVASADYIAAMGRLAHSVALITTRDPEGRRFGMTATAVASVSAEPPQLLICVNRTNACCARITEAGRFAVNYLRAEVDGLAPGHACVIFEVPDLAIAAHLVAFNGGTVTGTRDMGSHGRIALCTDPDGTPYEYICKVWTSEPDRFIVDPIHQMPGLNS